MPGKLMEYFNASPRIGTLSTADRSGKVDTGIFGSPRMIDEKTVIMGLGQNRSLANLKENPNAVFMIIEPGETVMDWKGIRVYMRMKDLATSGKPLEDYRQRMAAVAGKEAAAMIQAVVTFEVTELRPIMDMGQGWEKSI
jgi:Pyridoxamine 5'-phosphate oxidase